MVFPDPRGDWRWRSWAWLAAQAGAWAAALGDLPAGALVGYPWRPAPGGVAADLGIQAAGGVALPVVEGDEAALPALARWLAVAGARPPDGMAAPVVEAPAATMEESWRPKEASVPSKQTVAALPAPKAAAGGGALVRRHEGWESWGDRELASAVSVLSAQHSGEPTRDATARPGARPIALVAGDLAAAPERAWLGWALAAGAALVLPGDPAFAAWAIFWPRPTDVCLPAEQLAPVRELLATLGKPRAQRRRLARLSRLVVWGGEPAAPEAAAWSELGVTLRAFPVL